MPVVKLLFALVPLAESPDPRPGLGEAVGLKKWFFCLRGEGVGVAEAEAGGVCDVCEVYIVEELDNGLIDGGR